MTTRSPPPEDSLFGPLVCTVEEEEEVEVVIVPVVDVDIIEVEVMVEITTVGTIGSPSYSIPPNINVTVIENI